MTTNISNISEVTIVSTILQWLMALAGAGAALLQPTFPFIVICTIAVFMDCYTAWSLSRRVKEKYGKSDGYFRSEHFGRVFITLIKIYSVIILSFLMDKYIIPFDIALPNIIAGAVCFWQLWSMLENESSCSDAKWAKLAQKIMVDKTERHFNIDLGDLKNDN